MDFPVAPHCTETEPLKLGFLGGSFDPVHRGHVSLALAAYKQLGLDRVYFVPAGQAPLKDAVRASASHRLAMLRLVVDQFPQFDLLDWEIVAGGVSYTVDTAKRLRQHWPHARLFWLIGADQLAQFMKWKAPDSLARLLDFAWADRPGCDGVLPEGLPPQLRLHHIEGLSLPPASSEVRRRCKSGEDVSFLLPDCVNQYIKKYSLYRT